MSSHSHDILSQLRKLDFPECADCAIKHLKANFLREASSIPGLGGGMEMEMVTHIVEDFVFSNSKAKSSRVNMAPALSELHILELIMTLYKDLSKDSVPEATCFNMFQAFFGRASSDDVDRIHLLARLISLAISVSCSLLLDSAAMWMQLQGVQTSCVQMVIESLMRDFTSGSVGDSSTKLACLPQLSQHFTCIFISGVTTMCKYPGPAGSTQSRPFYSQLLPMLTSWIAADSSLCLVSLFKAQHAQSLQHQRSTLWTSPTKPNTQTPIPGLVRWATQGPTNNLDCRQGKALSFNSAPVKDNVQNEVKEADLELLWSRLHLGILQTLVAFPMLPGAPQLEVITLADMTKIVDELVIIVRQCEGESGARTAVETGLDRMIQVLQIALATGAFRCSLADLKKICFSLPETKLRKILENQHLSNLPPAMHNAS